MSDTLPVPADALQTSINYFDTGDRDAARYWLDVARELREGRPTPPVTHVFEPSQVAEAAAGIEHAANVETMRIPGYVDNDATSVINAVADNICPNCKGETFRASDGFATHRATYRVECEFATAGV